MHKIDLTTNNFQMRRFIILQLVIALFVILFTYKWALGVTAVVDQNIIINLVYGFAGFIILLILHELIHRALFLLFKKDSKPMFNIKKDRILFQTADACFNKWQFSIIMLSPLILLRRNFISNHVRYFKLNNATVSTCVVCGNISTGVTSSS